MVEEAVVKICTRCRVEKPIDEFQRLRILDKDASFNLGWLKYNDGRHEICRECKEYKRQNNQLKCVYKLNKLKFDKMVKDQGNACFLCERSFELARRKYMHVDHSHVTGKVRGILCPGCNHALGIFKDSPELLRKAANYIEERS